MSGAGTHTFRVEGPQARDSRLDQYLTGRNLGLTRNRLRLLIRDGQATVNGSVAKPAQRVRNGDRVTLVVPPPRPAGIVPQAMPVTVVYQDRHLVVVDKPAGLAVHPGPGHPDRTLVNALLALCPDIEGVGGEVRPGIVHRLDKDTSGLIMAAKTQAAHNSLSAQIKDRTVSKGYLALVEGVPRQEHGRIDAPVGRHPRVRTRMAVVAGGREARTGYRVVERSENVQLIGTSLGDRAAPIRSGSTSPTLAIPSSVTASTARKALDWTGTSFTPINWVSATLKPAQRSNCAPPCPRTLTKRWSCCGKVRAALPVPLTRAFQKSSPPTWSLL